MMFTEAPGVFVRKLVVAVTIVRAAAATKTSCITQWLCLTIHDPTLLISALCLLMRLQPVSFLDQERTVVDPEPEDLEILHYTE
jgi:uncharacterized protein (DUF983 family)